MAKRNGESEAHSKMYRKLRAISNCNQVLLRAEDEQTLLDEICHIICDQAGFRMAWVGYPKNDADKTIRPAAWAGVEDGYLAQSQITWADTEYGRGPSGTAIRDGETVCIQDFSTDPKAIPWRDAASQHRYGSSTAIPLKDENANTFGILNIYSTETNTFTPDEIELLEELAGDMAFGITTLRAQLEHKRGEEIMQARLRLLEFADAHSMDELLTATLDEIEVLTGSSIGFYHFVDTDQQTLTLHSWSTNTINHMCTAEGAGSHYPVDQAGVWADSVRERRSLLHNDYASLPNRKGMPDGHAPVIREVVVPIFRGDKIVAIIGVGNKSENYDESDIEIMSQLGDLSWDIAARRRVEEALREQEAKFRTVADYTYDWEYWLGPNQELLYMSPSCERITGYSRAEFEADPGLLNSIVYPADRNTMDAHMHDFGHLEDALLDFRIVHRDGGIRWITHGCQAIYGPNGQFMGRRISNRDDTKRKEAEQQLTASEQLFRTLVENSPDHIARYDLDLRRIYINPALQQLFKIPIAEAIGTTPMVSSPLTNPEQYMANIKQAIETEEELSDELSYLDNDGELHWVSTRFAPEFDSDGKVATVLVIANDITKRKQAEQELRLAASVFANSQEGILISDADNLIINVNPAFTRLTGYTRDEAIGRNPSFMSAGRQDQEFYAEMWRSINKRGEWKGELWNRRKSGEVYAEMLSIVAVIDDKGRLQHYAGIFSDITMNKQHEADLDRVAHYDSLTSVPNRRLLNDRMQQAIARAKRIGKRLAVCYIDLDNFKPINDTFGHESGDLLLVKISQRLQSLSRCDDTVARLGGDEFVLLWNDIGTDADCIRAIERVLTKISEPILIGGESVSASVSIGVTLYPDDNVDADTLLRHADHAMYTAKQGGKNRFQMFDPRLERQISSRTEFLDKLANAIDKNQFELYYQPKVDVVTSVVQGVEALLRWNDPILGLIGPKQFLPLIENDSLAFRMGRWVTEQAVRQAKNWDDMGLIIPISINIFPHHLKHRTFIDDLRDVIASHWPQIPRGRLLMEIVESPDLKETGPIEKVINACKEMGVGFSLDDFGTGFSSLVYLRHLSVEELKIDQSFVRNMLHNADDEAIVVSVISLGRAFKLRVVAEGVESTEQANHLINLGCSAVQGYGPGRPMPAMALQKWYADFQTNGVRMS